MRRVTWAVLGLLVFLPGGSRAGQSSAAEEARAAYAALDWGRAVTLFALLQSERQLSAEELDNAVESASRLNDWGQVSAFLERARTRTPLSFENRVLLYEALLRNGNAPAGERELQGLLSEQPANETLVHALAYLYLSRGDFEKAVEVYLGFVTSRPEVVESRINLALVEFKLAKTDAALEHLREAFTADSSRANEYYYRQLVRNMAPEDLKTLVDDTKQAIGQPLDGHRSYLYLAREFENLFRYQLAIENYQHYLEYEPGDGASRYQLAKLYFQNGQDDQSQAELQRLIGEKGPHRAASQLLAAELAVKGGDLEQAARMVAGLPAEFQSRVEYQYVSARLALAEGRLGEAEGLLQKVLAARPEMAEAYFHLGQLYLQTGRVEEGRAALARFQRLKVSP